MGTLRAYYTVGSGVVPGKTSISTHSYVAKSEDKTATARRVSPIGVNKLFSGTDVRSAKMTQYQGTAFRYFPNVNAPGGSWTLTSIPIAGVGNPGFGSVANLASSANYLRSEIQSITVNLAQALAERKQTAMMFVDFGGRLLRSVRALRAGSPQRVYSALTGGDQLPRHWKRDFRTKTGPNIPKHVFDNASDSWLAWQYGVRPLVQDLKGSVDAYWKARAVRPCIQRVNVKTKSERFSQTVFDPFDNVYAQTYASLKGRAVAYVEIQVGADLWSTADMLGLTNPALLAWELIPYSFVFDWFVNVGDYLQAAQSIRGLQRSGVHLTSLYKMDLMRSQYGGQSWQKNVIKTRSFSASLPGPAISVSSKPLNTEKTLDRVFSAIALARAPLSGVNLPSFRR